MEPLGPIVRARGDAITRAPPGPPEVDRPGHHSRNLSWDSSTSYNGSCSVSIRSERTFNQRRSSTTMGSEQAGRTSTSPTNQHCSLPSPIFPASSASYLARSTVSSSAASVITTSTATTRSRSFSIDSRSVYSLSEKDAPSTPTPRTRQRLQDTGAGSSTQQDTSRSRVSMDAVTPADETQSHTPRPDLWKSVSRSSLAMSSAAESSKRRGRVSFGPMDNYDWTATGAGDPFASSSRLNAVSPPPRPPRRKSVPSLGYGLAQQYCRPESEVEDTEPEDDWEERAQRTPTAFADSTLRSAPGVRGIGEGWAGGPQLSKTSWWKRRKRDALEDDPLALWDTAGKIKADTASPVKALWNRSVQAFGGSMPHLPLERRRTSKKDREKPTSQGTIFEDEEREVTGRRSMRQLFSRSTTSLAGADKLPKVRDRIPMSYSTSHLVSAPASSTGRIIPRSPIKERRSFVGSDTDSTATPTLSAMDTRRISGPRPPWRPQSHISIGQPLNEDDTEDGLATPKMDRDSSGGTATSDSSAARTERSIQRTSTFGAGLIADEPAHIIGHDNAPSETAAHRYEPVRDDYWSRRRDEMRDSTVGLDTIAQWSTEPKERMALPSRRPSIFRKIQQALGTPRSVSMRRSDSPSPLRLFSRATTPAFGRSTPAPGRGATSPPPAMSVERPASPMRATTDPAYLIMHEAVKEALETPPRAPQRSQTVRHRRRASWMSQGDGWMKRLSMLMEQDEDDRENRSSTASPISCISPQSPTPRGTKQAQRQSFFSTAVPQRTSSLRRPVMTPTRGSMSTPALTRLTTTDLDLRLVLPDAGLGLDDILIDSKRQSIIEMLDLDIPSTFPFPVPPARSPMAPALSRNPSVMSGHTRNASEPVNSLTPTTVRTSSHVRNVSEPVDVVPLLEESRSIPHSTGSASSSTFPETPHMTRADLYARRSRDHELSHKSSAASTTSWTDTSFHSAKEPAVEEVSLYKALSRLSDVSELGAVVEAVRIPSMGGTRKASMVTIEELRNSPMSTRPSTPVV